MPEKEIRELEPGALWRNFCEISRIPRRSGDEARVREFILSRAKALGLEHRMDSAGNLLVSKRGRGASKEQETVLLQSHLDMVCVARPGANHDFEKDPITLHSDGKYVMAQGTSLGADNGIGVAAMLALMEGEDLRPLDFLFTVDEETGLTGALGIDPALLTARRMLNFDTAEEGVLIIGCAGGLNITSTLSFEGAAPPQGSRALSLGILKGAGGHSGLDIGKHRANAIKILAGMLRDAGRRARFGLAHMRGGNRSNVIPREAEAVLMVSPGDMESVRNILQAGYRARRREYRETDPELTMDLQEQGRYSGRIPAGDIQGRLLDFIDEIPHGVRAMSEVFPGIVETSLNLATVRMEDGAVTIGMNARSPSHASVDHLAVSIQEAGKRFGFHTGTGSRYPGWRPDPQSALLKKARRVYEKAFGRTPGVRVVHAGLECGVIGSRSPGMDILSFGPSIENLHSPGERVAIDSVGRFWNLLKSLLEAI